MTSTIYMPLLNEGVDVWRPVTAWEIAPKTYIVLRPDRDPQEEQWRFPPGSTVDCEPRKTADGEILAAVRLHSFGRQTA